MTKTCSTCKTKPKEKEDKPHKYEGVSQTQCKPDTTRLPSVSTGYPDCLECVEAMVEARIGRTEADLYTGCLGGKSSEDV